ncbi:DUF2252 domain-containing protein [Rhodocyclus tenuis]|uniref:Uncharacterized protein (DUF2252 family) n=1 Tax=Rhodocyclus tenuis TaxID=1066 RepID=A0A840G1X3_RHOTE|nr:DUF2252 family protein [Rhodocyclus tenuis]MBB4245956.1 uncharacterized protein (DUF2252 family) [Rhodocyclus tenuis]
MSSQSSASVVDSIRRFNAGRDPERLALKLARMKESPFVFLRGACHLFYDALPDSPALSGAPLAWCCGDLHFENFGSYRADNGLVYFDINDYDEAALAPCTWDIVRLLTSIRCGADVLNASPAEALAVSHDCLSAYRAALLRGKPLWVERDTADGLVRELLVALHERNRAELLDRRTVYKGGRRQLKVDGVKALPAAAADRQAVAAFMAEFAATQADPGFFKVLDVARRIAGTGSLGVVRYVILVEGKGSPDGNYLFDLKEARPSALLSPLQRLGIQPPPPSDEAERAVAAEKRMQAVDHAFLYAVRVGDVPCVLRMLQPAEDRVAIGDWGRKIERLREVVVTLGRILAWDQLRAAGRSGAACADELSDFARADAWQQEVLDAAATMTALTRTQWQEFCRSAD